MDSKNIIKIADLVYIIAMGNDYQNVDSIVYNYKYKEYTLI